MFESLQGYNAIPGISDARLTVEKSLFWGAADVNRHFYANIIIDGASRDSGESPTTLLRPGLLMGKVTATGKLKQWGPTATDGTERIFGVLLESQPTQANGADYDRWGGIVALGGNIRASGLLIPGNSAYGISGDALENYVRNQMASRFLFDDEPIFAENSFGYNRVRNVTVAGDGSPYVLTRAMRDTLFTSYGSAAALQFTLPAVASNLGLRFGFFNAVDQNMTIASAAANGLITFNNAAASSVAFSTAGNKIGAFVEVFGIGNSKWAVRPSGANTMTVA